ncbi:unnamed protein product [Rodentolepis nana]|uniref:Carbohydrate kinase FGGY C-terminal domain-containing protein n=1 Tax=Rodentolepis nana TaxID=102285 RepID=A0A3P7SY77_RODNA|nr:unnamed protein product [Rodentolepis nana]
MSCEDVPDTKLEDVTFLLEGFNSDAGNSLLKLKEAGFFDSYSELEDTLKSITPSFDATLDGSSYFIPSSLGLKPSSTGSQFRMDDSERALSFVNTNTYLTDGGIFVGLPLRRRKGQVCITKSLKQAAVFALMDSLVMAARLLFVKGINKEFWRILTGWYRCGSITYSCPFREFFPLEKPSVVGIVFVGVRSPYAKLLNHKICVELASEITVLRVNGNLTRSDWLMQRLADTLNLPVERSSTSETCCLGAAIAAGIGAGIWKTYGDAVKLLQASKTRFEPIPPSVLRMRRRYLYWTGACAKVIAAHNSRSIELGEVISLNDLVSLAL